MFDIVMAPIADLKANARNVRTHSKKQIRQIASSIKQFGFVAPIIADETNTVIAGHGRLEAAKQLGLLTVPVVVVPGLSEAKKRSLMLADNKIASNAGWDRERLAAELTELHTLLETEGIDIAITGFETPEIDQLVIDFEANSTDPADTFAMPQRGPAITKPGDIWCLGAHRLMCGNARSNDDINRLMAGAIADMAFCDPPYNVAVSSVVGRGRTKHPEFAEASGEQTTTEFIEFLTSCLGNAARFSRDGAVHFVCMDWRHMPELVATGRAIYQHHLNTVVWVKTNAGQGSFYRSQHELICVFRVGAGPHTNNVELGRYGRSRSNVWTYPGVNTFRPGRMAELTAHPTPKPVQLVSDAIRDCTKRRDIVLDLFCGSGTTLLAAERVGRRGYGMDISPSYVDVAIRRWQDFTGKDAVLEGTTMTFEEISSSAGERQQGSCQVNP